MTIGHNSADGQLRGFVDRILRCREAEDEAKEDTKAVYADLKAAGYDKSAAGALVNEIRQKDKNPAQFEERNAVLDLYREAYWRASGTAIATHVHAGATPKIEGEQTHLESALPAHAVDESAEPQSQAKASEDNGSITGGAGAAAGEASRPDAGRSASATSEIMDATAGETAQDFQPPAFLVKERAPLRPHCLNPDLCAGSGREHCHACRKALAESEAA